jgi:hypothetical protein
MLISEALSPVSIKTAEGAYNGGRTRLFKTPCKMYAQRNVNYLVKHRTRNKYVMGIKCAFPSFSTTLPHKSFASVVLREFRQSVPGVTPLLFLKILSVCDFR